MRNTILFTSVVAVIVASMLIGVSRINAKPAALTVTVAADSVLTQSSQHFIPPAMPQSLPDSLAVTPSPNPSAHAKPSAAIPNRGNVQVWNGCGAEGAANRVADFLRSKGFDVKDIGNAPSWNYPATIVISRTADRELADEIGKALKTDKVTLMRNDGGHDATVIAGPDFEERVK